MLFGSEIFSCTSFPRGTLLICFYLKIICFTRQQYIFLQNGQAVPVANHLDEARSLELQENVWDDVCSAQYALQATRPQDAVQLWQEEEYVVHKPGN